MSRATTTQRALLIVDVQNDFCEGGSLAVTGGNAVAAGVAELVRNCGENYALIIGSRDWHEAEGDNGGHFATDQAPDYRETWPVHCVQGTDGAAYHPALADTKIDIHIYKGMGEPAYSAFEGVAGDETGEISKQTLASILRENGITELDVAGIATDYCVLASVRDALREGLRVRVLERLVAGVDETQSLRALERLAEDGAVIFDGDASRVCELPPADHDVKTWQSHLGPVDPVEAADPDNTTYAAGREAGLVTSAVLPDAEGETEVASGAETEAETGSQTGSQNTPATRPNRDETAQESN